MNTPNTVPKFSLAGLHPEVLVETVDIIGDMNGDSRLDNFDIDPFVDALLSLPP